MWMGECLDVVSIVVFATVDSWVVTLLFRILQTFLSQWFIGMIFYEIVSASVDKMVQVGRFGDQVMILEIKSIKKVL